MLILLWYIHLCLCYTVSYLLLLIFYAGLLPALPLFNSYAGSFDCAELPGREPQPPQCTATCVQLHGSVLESVLRPGQILILLVTSPELLIKISTGKTYVPHFLILHPVITRISHTPG